MPEVGTPRSQNEPQYRVINSDFSLICQHLRPRVRFFRLYSLDDVEGTTRLHGCAAYGATPYLPLLSGTDNPQRYRLSDPYRRRGTAIALKAGGNACAQ